MLTRENPNGTSRQQYNNKNTAPTNNSFKTVRQMQNNYWMVHKKAANFHMFVTSLNIYQIVQSFYYHISSKPEIH